MFQRSLRRICSLGILASTIWIFIPVDCQSSTAEDKTSGPVVDATITLPEYLGANVYLTKGETELLNKAYNSYMSRNPEEAIQEFETFLEEFPDSPAKDAAFFYLAKSFAEVKDFDMAGRLLADIKQMFPGSRLVPYVSKELDKLGKLDVTAARNLKKEPARQAGPPLNSLTPVGEAKPKRTEVSESGVKDDEAPVRETKTVSIGGKKYGAVQIEGFMNIASSATDKSGIKEVLWRKGDIYEDFISEQILYEDAERSAVQVDGMRYKELMKSALTNEQRGYLYRYLSIVTLVEMKIPGNDPIRSVECMSVTNVGEDSNSKVVLATELQAQAKKGLSFEEISRAHSETVKFSIKELSELQERIKEATTSLQDGEIVVVWTKDGYTILKPVTRRPYLVFRGEMQDNKKEEIRGFVKKYLEELRKKLNVVIASPRI